MSLKDKIIIPNYSLGEELVNSISHGIGNCSISTLCSNKRYAWKSNCCSS